MRTMALLQAVFSQPGVVKVTHARNVIQALLTPCMIVIIVKDVVFHAVRGCVCSLVASFGYRHGHGYGRLALQGPACQQVAAQCAGRFLLLAMSSELNAR